MSDTHVPRTLSGLVDAVDGGVLSGWAVDLASPRQPIPLLLVIDDQPVGTFSCSEPRPDVSARGVPGTILGFRIELPAQVRDGRLHRVAIRFRDGYQLPHLTPVGESSTDIRYQYHHTKVHGVVDGITGFSVRGWVFREDLRTGQKQGGVTVEIRANGSRIGVVKASLIRNDVAEAHGCSPHCGFLFALPSQMRDGKESVLEFYVLPEGVQLDGSPFTASVLSRNTTTQLYSIYAQVERLTTQLYALKDQLRQMLTVDEHTMETYSFWADRYYPALGARVVAERRTMGYAALLSEKTDKVSIICPTYLPNLELFQATVASVLAQSWIDWELIIVDDGSGSRSLTEAIDRMTKLDSRIRAVSHQLNRGISHATNTGIDAAIGNWIAFLDHDDLLVDVALETMLLAARKSGAKMLYSDEDKIDESGFFSEPNLKTDWNRRLLLAHNYVCHLMMVETETLRKVGQLRSEYDGAQDHDLVLRLGEALDEAEIHHVPELLYHWRKTEHSTASEQSSKNYAVDAGRRAIIDHLERHGLKADVEAPFASTFYDARFEIIGEPSVSILIPFRDQPETTRRCVECILKVTDYQSYEIVLIDNWSTDTQTRAWLDTLGTNPRIRVIRIEEAFNFSRINNLAAQQVDSELLVFMNNDIFVAQPDWLSLMVGEALADPHVGIVGIKLVYPNQTVQHAGVVLGVGGVADHTFRYHPRDERGYAFRAVAASDMSAVTGACMLCRADAFRAVGMFDEQKLAVAFNDVDLCLKIRQAGYRVVFTPAVVAEHHESLSRGSDLAEHNLPRFYDENQTMWDRWGELLRNDPFYNPHFSHEAGIYEKLSSASLDPARAPSLLQVPVKRAALAVAPPLKISHIRASRTSRAGENGQVPVAEGATGPRKRSGKVDRTGSRVSGKPTARRVGGVAAPTE